MAETKLWLLVKVITSKDVPPALMVLGLKVLDTVGTLAVIVSLSVALQVPAMQAVAVLVLVTDGGAEMDTVLVTWVCAKASCGIASDASRPVNSDNTPKALAVENREGLKRLTNLASTGMRTPNSFFIVATKQFALIFCNIYALIFTCYYFILLGL